MCGNHGIRYLLMLAGLIYAAGSHAADAIDTQFNQCLARHPIMNEAGWSTCHERAADAYLQLANRYYDQQIRRSQGQRRLHAQENKRVFGAVYRACNTLEEGYGGYQEKMICRVNMARQFAQSISQFDSPDTQPD